MPSTWPQAVQAWPDSGIVHQPWWRSSTQKSWPGTSHECGPATSVIALPWVAMTGTEQAWASIRGSSNPPAIAQPIHTSAAP